MRFAEIPGLIDEKSKLIASVHKNHMAHAQLFYGPEGSGNLALALAFITYINCEKPGDADACGECASCSKMSKLVHPDVSFAYSTPATSADPDLKDVSKPTSKDFLKFWRPFATTNPYGNLADWARALGAEGKPLLIRREESRQIISTLALTSFEGKYKAMVIWLPENMHISAANALLKIVEEPPEKTFFFFVSNDYESIINTIISRTQLVTIRAFTDDDISGFLVRQHGVDEAKAKTVARLAGGNMNLALKLVAGEEDESMGMFREWMRACWMKDYEAQVRLTDRFNSLAKVAQKTLLEYGLTVMRESLIVKSSESSLLRVTPEEEDFVTKFSGSISVAQIEAIAGVFNDCIYHLERNANVKILFMDLSLQLTGLLRGKVLQAQ